jgi:predicted ribonuclease toxin of YeeF-YezG toxin-antitoxin module
VDTNDFLIECGASIENYQTGFHIFKTFEAAKHRLREYRFFSNDVYIIAKVSAKNVVATGYESVSTGVLQPIKQVDVFVAKEMILEKIVYTTYNQVWRRFKEWLHSKFSSRG